MSENGRSFGRDTAGEPGGTHLRGAIAALVLVGGAAAAQDRPAD
ncbi:MAG: hypothetical protein U0804_08625 [Gemmataceae bacterium]